MNMRLRTSQVRIWAFLRGDAGQDLIEYALVVSLIAFAAVASMGTLATNINVAFTQIGAQLTTATA